MLPELDLSSLNRWDVWVALVGGTLLGGVLFQVAYRICMRAHERRTARRRWGNPMPVRIADYQSLETIRCGLVVNRSDGGIALVVDQAYTPGTPLRIRAAEAPATIPWVPVEVRHCRSAGRNWMIGCQFKEEVTWEVLAWFG